MDRLSTLAAIALIGFAVDKINTEMNISYKAKYQIDRTIWGLVAVGSILITILGRS